jgi:hypothetical protein
VKEYDIFVPLFLNDGRPIEPAKFQLLQTDLLEHFEGLTYFPQPNQGIWKFGGLSYKDEIVIYRVISRDALGSRAFLVNFKERLKKQFEQLEILIIEREIDLL